MNEALVNPVKQQVTLDVECPAYVRWSRCTKRRNVLKRYSDFISAERRQRSNITVFVEAFIEWGGWS